ncbi:hypothetical protein LPJ38_26460 [Bradyrhizobium daqingense]|uniref:Uncharacterized protein n=1 Tax=Bradyrhizobium daqingense TaxID=993502 RepID=A0A562LMV9_9BRAD|nr:hypothetical protein [Bradyrhizobium daqingense]TWI08916.1 hypothetical protein IQ17_01741 [Bradyrhizobium daqingense]UFS87174.1 hypothetical protein LPJ38_26460 [Bradyrhizobium daqingense]
MSAISALVQSNAVHMMTDTLLYVHGKVVQTDFPKCLPIRGMRAAIASTGPASFSYLLAEMLANSCATFDQVVAKDREWFHGAFDWYIEHERVGASEYATVVLVGWLEAEDRPAAFAIELSNGGEKLKWVRENSAHTDPDSVAHDLVELPILANPTPPIEDLLAAGWPIGVNRDSRDAELDLLHMMEIQRRRRATDGIYYVGGHAVLTTVTREGVSQRAVHRWREDRAGKKIRPKPMDWTGWRARRVAA